MHDVFQTHYHQHPSSRFPHIPSIPISIPVDYPTQHDFCYTARYLQQPQTVSQEDVHATAAALLHALQELEDDRDAQNIQETNQESGSRPVRKYFIKRNYSGGHNSLCLAPFGLAFRLWIGHVLCALSSISWVHVGFTHNQNFKE